MADSFSRRLLFFYSVWISPAQIKAYFAMITAIPVNTSDTPEWGSRVNPRYLVTVGGAFVILPPM